MFLISPRVSAGGKWYAGGSHPAMNKVVEFIRTKQLIRTECTFLPDVVSWVLRRLPVSSLDQVAEGEATYRVVEYLDEAHLFVVILGVLREVDRE